MGICAGALFAGIRECWIGDIKGLWGLVVACGSLVHDFFD